MTSEAGYFSVAGGKWHRAIVPRPTFMRDEQTACGLTVRPLNVTWDGAKPDYVRPDSFCKHCEARADSAESKLAPSNSRGTDNERADHMPPEWTWGNDTPAWRTPRRTVYFIYRRLPDGSDEFLEDRRGRMREWRSQEAVKRALRKLLRSANP